MDYGVAAYRALLCLCSPLSLDLQNKKTKQQAGRALITKGVKGRGGGGGSVDPNGNKERHNLVLDLGNHAQETITDMQRNFVQVGHMQCFIFSCIAVVPMLLLVGWCFLGRFFVGVCLAFASTVCTERVESFPAHLDGDDGGHISNLSGRRHDHDSRQKDARNLDL